MHRQPYKGCPFECNLAEITRNETVWRMRTNNVKKSLLFIILKNVNISNKFNFRKVYGIVNTLGLLQKRETQSIHGSMNLPKSNSFLR